MKFYKGRRPPRFRQERKPAVRLDDAYSHDDEWVGKLSDTIVTGGAIPETFDEQLVIDAANAERPFLSEREVAALDWLLGRLSGADRRSLVQFADDQSITKGGASKLRDRVCGKIKRRLKK